MKPLPSDWLPERVAELIQRFNAGESFTSIAGAMALTHNAVIGKCDRLGLSREPVPRIKRPRSDSTKNKTFKRITAPKFSDEPLPPPNTSDLAIPRRRRKNIFTFTPTSCRFPVGDPGTKDFFFCGARKLDLLPYCAEHAKRCFRQRS